MQQSMMLYVHIPFCVQKCHYCDFLSFPVAVETRKAYLDALCKEISAWKGKEAADISSVFIGGGTPSLLTPHELEPVIDALHESFQIEKKAEQTIEVNPGTVTQEKALFWKQKGINRISMGVQSLEDELLKKLGRIHTRKQVFESWQILQEAGFQNLSLDLMMGLPDQTLFLWEKTLKEVLSLKPKHLSCYSLILEEGTPFYRQQEELKLPDEETERQMYWCTQEILSKEGLQQYEISNFSQPGYESRHNTGYWRRKPYIGLGLGASSLLKEEIRTKNTEDMSLYLAKSHDPIQIRVEEQKLGIQEQMEEFMFLGLRCTQGVKKSEFLRLFQRPLESVYQTVLERHFQYGLLKQEDDFLRLTQRGMDLANQVFADFLLE